MQCDDFMARWQELLDDRELPEQDDLLCSHASQCSECHELLHIQTTLFREIDQRKRTSAVRAPLSRVPVASAANARRFSSSPFWQKRPSRLARILVSGAIAGSVLLLFLLPLLQVSGTRSGAPIARSAARSNGGDVSTVWMAHPQARNDVRPTVAPNSFSEDKTSKAKPDQQLELLNTSVADGRQTTEKVSQAAEDGLEPLDQIAGGLRPLADTLDVAWETFCRSIADPVERAQAMQDDPPPFEWSLWPVSAS